MVNGLERTNLGKGKLVSEEGAALLQEEKMLAARVATVVARTGEREEAAQRSEVKLTRWMHGGSRRERRKKMQPRFLTW